MYHYQDIELIVEEARLRGIQVILEIDTPGHGTAFGKVFPGKDVCLQINGSNLF